MAERQRRFLPMGGFVDSALANELVVTWYSMTVTPSRKPRHRPPNFESAALRLCIVGDYVRLKAFGRRKVVNEISAHYRVDRSHVFAAIKSVDPKLLAKLEAHAADDVALHRRFAGRQHALVRHHGIRSLDLTRLFS